MVSHHAGPSTYATPDQPTGKITDQHLKTCRGCWSAMAHFRSGEVFVCSCQARQHVQFQRRKAMILADELPALAHRPTETGVELPEMHDAPRAYLHFNVRVSERRIQN